MVEIHKGMYSLSQARILAHQQLVKHIVKSLYLKCRHTSGLFTHQSDATSVTLVGGGGFGIKYVDNAHADWLLVCLHSL